MKEAWACCCSMHETRKVTRCSYTSPHTVLPFQHLRKYLQKPHEKSLLSASMINKGWRSFVLSAYWIQEVITTNTNHHSCTLHNWINIESAMYLSCEIHIKRDINLYRCLRVWKNDEEWGRTSGMMQCPTIQLISKCLPSITKVDKFWHIFVYLWMCSLRAN
jgi:hypothetical protein